MLASTTRGRMALAHAIEALYREGESDYGLQPLVLVNEYNQPRGRICDGDAVIFCCRRGEREVQLTEAFTDPDFPHFARPALGDLQFAILTLYSDKFRHLPVAFAPSRITDTLAHALSNAGLRQAHIAESEKFAHVTFFFNGGNSEPIRGEEDFRIQSRHDVPFDQVPELSLPGVARQVQQAIADKFDFIVANFANGDVIGHTSNNGAKVQCARVVDHWLGEVINHANAADYLVFVTADHGNLELMENPDGSAHVAHTCNPVPFIMIDPRSEGVDCVRDGSLADVAPTVLAAVGINPLRAMDFHTLAPRHAWRGKRNVLLLILDGWGIGRADESNPIHLAETPHWDALLRQHAHSRLKAAGEAVGLEEGKAGNSEAGHMNIGAGRVIPQDDVRLEQALGDGTFRSNEVLLRLIEGAQARRRPLHLIGLLSEKSSHGSVLYPLAILRMAHQAGLREVFVHLILDGRSTQPGSAPRLLADFEQQVAQIGTGEVVTCMGRALALDRDGDYEKTRRAFDALVHGVGRYVGAA